MIKIAITGASGFIGKNLSDDLVKSGHHVLRLGRTVGPKIEPTDYSFQNLTQKLQGFNIIIHLAGERLTRETDLNRLTPLSKNSIHLLDNLLLAAKECGICKVITMSSIGVYSLSNICPFLESEIAKPANPYGLTKLISEQQVDMWGQKNQITTSHIRLASCFGYGEKDSPALMKFVKQACQKQLIRLNNGGHYQIDQIYINDVISAIIKLIDLDVSGSFNIGSGTGYSVKHIAETINQVFNNINNLEIEPATVKQIEPKRHMDISKAKAILNWHPQTNLRQNLEDMKKAINNAKY